MDIIYNPATGSHEISAKLWELLRRNPELRRDVKRFVPREKQLGQPAREAALEIIRREIRAPLATFVFRWLFCPKYYQFRKTLRPSARLFLGENLGEIEKLMTESRNKAQANKEPAPDPELILNTP